MEETQRVDIKVDLETLAWAASEATKLGISRRKFLAHRLKVMRLLEQSGAVDLNPFKTKPE